MSCWNDGSPDSQLLIIGMAPGREELEADQPFVGPAGRLLWSLLKKAGIDRADCYILNIIGEWPEGKTGGPTDDQLERYWDRFDAACAQFTGPACMVLGGDALARFSGLDGGITGWGGYLLRDSDRRPLTRKRVVETQYKTSTKTHKKGDPRFIKVKETVPPPPFKGLIIPALHPAGVLRTGLANAPILASQCRKVARALAGTLQAAREDYHDYPCVFFPTPTPAGPATIDIETGGIDNGIVRVGMASRDSAWSAPWGGAARITTKANLERASLTIYHNGGFDIPRLDAAGCPTVSPIFDTMLAAAMLQPDLPKGLNACGALYLDCPRWKHLDEENPALYNALDAIRTYELYEQLSALLDRTGQSGLFQHRIMAALPVLIRMGQRGIALSDERRTSWLGELSAEAKRLHTIWTARTNGVNPNSSHQLKQLFRQLGMDPQFNKDGGESADALAIATLRADYPQHADLLDTLIALKRTLKDIQTYALVAVGADGRVHPSFVPAYKDDDGLGKGLAGTWRITAKDPNLQNQPTRARRMYCPKPGHSFVGADYSQLEARILAAISGDSVLLADCDAGIHARNAERLRVDKTRAKNGFYGWSYLGGAGTLQNTFKARGFSVTKRECEELLRGFDTIYNVAAGARQQILAEAQARRYVENPFGLRRYFPNAKWPAPAAMSTHIQSTGAIMMWTILPALEKVYSDNGGQLLLTVHDDVLGEVPTENKDATMRAVVSVMEQEFPEVAAGFRCPVTPKTSDLSWGEMEDVALSA